MVHGIIPFWRSLPFNEKEEALISQLFTAHRFSTFRDSPSTVALKVAIQGSGRFENGIGAAVLSIGGIHAPVRDICEFLSLSGPARIAEIDMLLCEKKKVVGWGSSFVKSARDQNWIPVHDVLRAYFPTYADILDSVTAELEARGKKLLPNPGGYTAACALALGMKPSVSPYLFIAARLSIWAMMAAEQLP